MHSPYMVLACVLAWDKYTNRHNAKVYTPSAQGAILSHL